MADKLLLTEEDYHYIDGQLHLESLCTVALVARGISIDEYELHRDEHLRQIVTILAKAEPLIRKEERERIYIELGATYKKSNGVREFLDNMWNFAVALREGKL